MRGNLPWGRPGVQLWKLWFLIYFILGSANFGKNCAWILRRRENEILIFACG